MMRFLLGYLRVGLMWSQNTGACLYDRRVYHAFRTRQIMKS